MSKSTKERLCRCGALLLTFTCQQALVNSPAQAAAPAGCVGCGVSVLPGTQVQVAINGTTVPYTVDVQNPANGCNLVGATVIFFCAGANGLPDLNNGIILDTNLNLGQGQTKTYSGIQCTINTTAGFAQVSASVSGPPGSCLRGPVDRATGTGTTTVAVTTQCPPCVDPVLIPGSAISTAVLELGAGTVSITGPAGGLLGNIDIGPGGKLSMSGSEYITGKVRLAPGATFSNSGSGAVGGVEHNVDLSAEINAAYQAAAAWASAPCSQSYTTLDGKVATIVGGSGVNVICVKDVSLSGKQILLTGPPDALFVFNVTGKFTLTGGGNGPQIRVDPTTGLKPSSVLYNIIGTGPDVAFSGGGGGVGCCKAIVDGTLLAPFRKVALSPGLVNGEVISGMNISIVSGSSVRCPCVPP